MIMTVRDEDHADAVEIGRRFEKIGYHIFATSGTARALNEAGVKATPVRKIEQESPNLLDLDPPDIRSILLSISRHRVQSIQEMDL